MSKKASRKVPEFVCPIKYRASLPDHSIFPSLYNPPLFTDDLEEQLLGYRPTVLETSGVRRTGMPFEVFRDTELGDFVDLKRFVPVGASTKEKVVSVPETVQDAQQQKEAEVVTLRDGELRHPDQPHWNLLKRIPIEMTDKQAVMLTFDHDPHTVVDAQLIVTPSGDTYTMSLVQPDDRKQQDYEAREMSQTAHDYYVINADWGELPDKLEATRVVNRLHLRKKR